MARAQRGDVWQVDMGIAGKVRPCLLLTDYPADDELAMVTVLPHTTAVKGNRKLAVYVAEREWHPSQKLKHRADGRVEMRLETTGRKELVRWVLSWIPDVKVLAPKSLRNRIAEKLQDGLRRQDEASGPNQTLHTNREQARGR